MALFNKFYNWIKKPKRIHRLESFLVNRYKDYKEGILAERKIQWMARRNRFGRGKGKPIVLISYCKKPLQSWKDSLEYGGGMKLFNLWAKLLRDNGFETYIVTGDGEYQNWLIEHQPVISLAKAKEWKAEGKNLKFLTSWLDADAFIEMADEVYYFDAELSWTLVYKKLLEKYFKKSKIRGIATHSRTQQAWYMANFGITPIFVPIWSDENYWISKPEKKEPGLVGYMDEGIVSETEKDQIDDICRRSGVNFKFIKISGDEKEVLDKMQRCDFYLGLNPYKNTLWGEGSPLTQQEAMHSGCVVVAFDVFGNREYMIHGFNGFLAPIHRVDILAEYLIKLMKNQELKEEIRKNSINFISNSFTSRNRWPLFREFLELSDEKENIMSLLSSIVPTYMVDEEKKSLSVYAGKAKETLVEIGPAFGGSTAILLSNSLPSADIFSIDPFIKDSMSEFMASAKACKKNVERALKILRMPERLKKWHLYEEPSYDAVKFWKRPIDFLFIDGDHRYEPVKKDFNDWFPFVKSGGYIIMHDSRRKPEAPNDVYVRGWPGPTRLAEELKKRADLELIDEVFSLTIWKKK